MNQAGVRKSKNGGDVFYESPPFFEDRDWIRNNDVPSRNLVAVIFDDESGEAEKRLTEAVKGDVERDPEDISRLTDWDLVARAHKEKNVSDRKALTSLLVSRTASKDIIL